MARQEREALGLVPKKHGAQVAVAQAHVALLGHRAGNAEGLKADADGLGRVGGGLHVLLYSYGATQGIGPAGVLKCDGLHALYDIIGVEALLITELASLLQAAQAVLGETFLNFGHPSLFAFKHDFVSHLVVLLIKYCLPIILPWGRCIWRRRRSGHTGRYYSYRPRRGIRRGGYPPASCPALQTDSR